VEPEEANMRRLLIVLGSLVIVVALAVSWLGVVQVPVLSAAFGMDKPRDLQMVQDRAAFNDFCAKWGIERPSPAANYTLSSKHHWSGTVAVDDTISAAAIASLREFNTSNAHFSQIQFWIHEGYIAMSAFVNVPGYPISGPMYGEFSIGRTGNRTVAVDISHLEFGRIGVPGNVLDTVKTSLDAYLNTTVLEAGITIDTLQLHEGAIRFKGTWPKTITADAPNSADIP
jgi:hypothetical protein